MKVYLKRSTEQIGITKTSTCLKEKEGVLKKNYPMITDVFFRVKQKFIFYKKVIFDLQNVLQS